MDVGETNGLIPDTGMGFISYPKRPEGPTCSFTSRGLGTPSSEVGGAVKRQEREADKPHLVYRFRNSAIIPTFPRMTSRCAEKLHVYSALPTCTKRNDAEH